MQNEIRALKRHAEFLVRSRAEEKEIRKKETRKRKSSDQIVKALRMR